MNHNNEVEDTPNQNETPTPTDDVINDGQQAQPESIVDQAQQETSAKLDSEAATIEISLDDAPPLSALPDDIIVLADDQDDDGELVVEDAIDPAQVMIDDLGLEVAQLRRKNNQIGADLEDLREELELAVRDRDDFKNRLMRTAADLENVRKRKEREKDELRKYGAERVVNELLPAVDNLERALEHATKTQAAEPDADSSIADGVRMVLKQLLAALEKHGVKGYVSLHERFDPQRHEAIQQIETSEHETGIVLQEFQKGYFLHDRLLRAALVVVSKYVAPPEPEDADEDIDLEEVVEEGTLDDDSSPILEEIQQEDDGNKDGDV